MKSMEDPQQKKLEQGNKNQYTMNIGFIILCRYNSRRLPGKILKKINGKPILQYIIERLQTVINSNNIVIATSEEETDDPIESYCLNNNINLFRGSLENVSGRFLACAENYGFDFATRINGDNFFMDASTLREMIKITCTGKYNFVSNLKGRTFPKGMSIEIVRTDFYKDKFQQFSSNDDFEHVTLNLYQNESESDKFYHYKNTQCPEAGGIQLAIDDQDDFHLAEQIIHTFAEDHTRYGLNEVFQLYQKYSKHE